MQVCFIVHPQLAESCICSISQSATSWCGYMRDQANQRNCYKHGTGLLLDAIAELEPIFARLSEVSLLRCLEGKTQN